jgi:D-tyrosyl-tRNA(Tyr) deacylase
MRAVVQRVTRARVLVDGGVVAAIERAGLCVLLGVTHDDGPDQVTRLARKIVDLRILRGERSGIRAAGRHRPVRGGHGRGTGQ